MTLTIKAHNPSFAAEVEGVDLREPLPSDVFAEIDQAFARYAVLIFRNQPLSDDEQIAFTKLFGPLETAPNYAGTKMRLRNEMTDISNLDHEGKVLDPADRLNRYNLGNQLWHTDSSFKAVRAKCSLLSAREVAPVGGETQYADMRAAYDALPADRKAQLSEMVAEHSIAHSRRKVGFDSFNSDVTTTLPPVPQRVVDHRVDTGRSNLYLASHASHVLGMPVEQGRALLEELIEFATQDQFVYTHTWQVGDVVIWDNRCTMHRGRPYDAKHRRVLHRTTVSDVETPYEAAAASA